MITAWVVCSIFLTGTLVSAGEKDEAQASLMKGARESGILNTFVPDPQGSGYMLAFPMDESGAVGAESAPIAEVAAPPEDQTTTTTTTEVPSSGEEEEKKEDKDATGKEQMIPVVVVPNPIQAPAQQDNGPTREQIDIERRRKMEEMRKILGLPPTFPYKPKPIPREKPKPSFPSLFKILPKFQSPLDILTRRSDDGSPRFAVISDILQVASSFMKRALIEEEVNTLQDIGKDSEKDKDDKDEKDDVMFQLLDDDDKTKEDKNSEPDLEDLISLIPLPRPMPIPIPFRPSLRRLPPRFPFGLPMASPPPPPPRRPVFNFDPRRISGPRMVPIEMAQTIIRPIPIPQPLPFMPVPQMMPQMIPHFGHHMGPMIPHFGHHMGPMIPMPSHPGPQLVPIFPVSQPAMPRMSRMMHPQHFPVPMHPEPFLMHRPHYPQPIPMQPVMVMLHPTIVPHFVPRPVYVPEPQPIPIPFPVEMEQRQEDSQESPVLIVEDSRGGRSSFPFLPRPSPLSPLQKVQIIKELLMASRQSLPIFPFGRPNVSPVPHFHPPVPQQKRPEPREAQQSERASGSFLRPIFLPL